MALLEGKTAIITGGGTGIGRAIAERFFKEGAHIVICGRRKKNLEDTANYIAKGNRTVSWIRADVTLEEDVLRVVDTAIDKTGRIDILVNSAGILRFGALEDTDLSVFDMLMKTNVYAPCRLMEAVLTGMQRSGGGSIVNISSIGGIKAFQGVGMYCASKAALQMISQVMALEVATYNIRVNIICPSMVEGTEIANTEFGQERVCEYYDSIRSLHPLGRNGNPEDVADAALFLASDQSSWVTGTILNLDGGRHLVTGRPAIDSSKSV